MTQGDNVTSAATDHRVAHLEARLAEVTEQLKEANERIANLRSAYRRALEQLALMRRRIFSAKAERVEAAGLQLAFDSLLAQAEDLKSKLVEMGDAPSDSGSAPTGDAESKDDARGNSDNAEETDPGKGKTRGRRKLDQSSLPLIRIEVTDPELEGVAERIGFEDSYRLGYERGGLRRIQVARAVYKVVEPAVATQQPAAQGAQTTEDGASSPGHEGPGQSHLPLPYATRA